MNKDKDKIKVVKGFDTVKKLEGNNSDNLENGRTRKEKDDKIKSVFDNSERNK